HPRSSMHSRSAYFLVRMAKDLRAFILGLLLFAGLTFAYLTLAAQGGALGRLPRLAAAAVIFSAPVLAGGVCRLLTPSRPITTLFALGIAAALLDFTWRESGPLLDVSPQSQIGWIVAMSLMAIPLLVVTGGVLVRSLRDRFGL